MSNKINLKIVTPHGLYFQGAVDDLTLDTVNGQMGILPNHLPLVTVLAIGEMHYHIGTESSSFAIAGGFLHVDKHETIIMTDAIEKAEDIDTARAEAAKLRAEERIASKREDIDLVRVDIALKKAINRLKISR